MCRKRALAATAQMLVLLAASPALAWGSKPPAPTTAAPAPAAASKTPAPDQASAQAASGARKASPDIRAQADRMEPLARAAFWASQVDADPKDAEAGVKLAASLRTLGRYPEASAAAEAVLVQQPKSLDALLEKARAAIASGQGFYAVEPSRAAMELAPKDWRPATLLAVGLDQAQRPIEAMEAHRKALQLAPDNTSVLSNAAMFYAAQGDRAQAGTLLRKAAAQPDATLQVRQNLALVLGLQGKLAEAEQIEREYLPPQIAQANLDYLKATSAR
ncbi:MAG: tetratricopeptide repeat protein [Caulobacteraceae bacterium]